MYAKHSIHYNSLDSYFLVFGIWVKLSNHELSPWYCMSWDSVERWCAELNFSHVPVLYKGVFHENQNLELDTQKQEGYVVRLDGGFFDYEFSSKVAKKHIGDK